MADATPTVRQRELAARLRNLRLASGMSVADVAERLMISPAKLSRLETAARPPQLRDVRDLCGIYGVRDEVVNELLTLAREARQRGWWQRYELIGEADTYTGLESSAVSMSNFESLLVPGLFQTQAYARAVVTAFVKTNLPQGRPDDVLKVRAERQQRLLTDSGPDIWVVLDEAALHRQVGGRAVMAEQVERLIEATQLPNVTFQILPFSSGAHPAMQQGSFVILQLAPEVTGDVVFIEDLLGFRFQERTDDLIRYRKTFDRLRADADSPERTAETLEHLRNKYA